MEKLSWEQLNKRINTTTNRKFDSIRDDRFQDVWDDVLDIILDLPKPVYSQYRDGTWALNLADYPDIEQNDIDAPTVLMYQCGILRELP